MRNRRLGSLFLLFVGVCLLITGCSLIAGNDETVATDPGTAEPGTEQQPRSMSRVPTIVASMVSGEDRTATMASSAADQSSPVVGADAPANPLDPARIVRRIVMTGRWAHYGEYSYTPFEVTSGDEEMCDASGLTSVAPAQTRALQRWSSSAGGDARFSLETYTFENAQQAADWVSGHHDNFVPCADAGVPTTVESVDVAETVRSQQEYTHSSHTPNSAFYPAYRIATAQSPGEHEIVFAAHGNLGFTLAMRPGSGPGLYDQAGWAELLQKFDIAVSSPPLVSSTNSSLMDEAEFEDMMVSALRERAFAYQPKIDCILSETLDVMEERGSVPSVVMGYVLRWCAPEIVGRGIADDPSRLVGLDDDDLQTCFTTVRIRSNQAATVMDTVRADVPEQDPFGPERAALDQQLLDECGIDGDDGVIAGLDPRNPLDNSAEREAYCAGRAEGLGLDRNALDQMTEVDRLVAVYRAQADQVARLSPPPTIADEWRRRGEYLTEKARVHETEQIGEVAIYTHLEFQAFEDTMEILSANAAIGEYDRMNCL